MIGWSPSHFAWFCPQCPATMLDGSIVQQEHTWHRRIMNEERRRITEYLVAVINH